MKRKYQNQPMWLVSTMLIVLALLTCIGIYTATAQVPVTSERDVSEVAWWNHTVFYELFVRSFYDSDGDGIGDFNGLTQKLDYLNDGNPATNDDLGITGIWLMPINQSPSYHGYDVVDYRSVNSDYGSLDDFRNFLEEAHDRGIRVIIDFVMNHSSNQHPWFLKSAQNDASYRNYYRWSDTDPGYRGPWGQTVWHTNASGYYYGLFWSGMPDLNYDEPAVKEEMFAAADFWLNEIGVDGFRLDAVLYLLEEGAQLLNTPSTLQFWDDFSDRVKQANPSAQLVCEAWTDSETVLKYMTDDRLDYCFEFELASSILNSVKSGRAQFVSDKMQDVYDIYPHLQYGTFLTNHDMNRVMNELGNDVSKAKLAAALYLTLPGVPYIYYGEEIGMVGAKPDQFIRTPMQWSKESNAGFTTGSPWITVNDNYSTYNVSDEEDDPSSLLNWYKQLIALRNQEVSLRVGEYARVLTSSASVVASLRYYEDEWTLVLVNLDTRVEDNLSLTVPPDVVPLGNYTLSDLLNGDSVAVSIGESGVIDGLSIGGFETLIYSPVSLKLNVAPVVVDSIEDIELIVGGDILRRSLNSLFLDEDADPLSFTATSSEETVASATISGSILRVTAVGVGAAAITVSAHDGRGGMASFSFRVTVPTGVNAERLDEQLPAEFALDQNYPNPFNTSTRITYVLAVPTHVRLTVFDALGRRVAELVNDNKTAGRHEVGWKTPGWVAGVYFYRLEAGSFVDTKTMYVAN